MFVDEKILDEMRDELVKFLKVCKGNSGLLLALCEVGAIDGGRIDECCVEVGEEACMSACRKAIQTISDGVKVNGKDGHFSAGDMGSRWMDLNKWARENGFDYCRCAFYSKKFSKKWNCEKPYRLTITLEKAR